MGGPSFAERAETKFVAGSSGRFAFRRVGRTGVTPLILCHRFRGTIDDWDPALLVALAQERDVIVFDNLGVGYSSGEVPSTASAMADATLELAQLLGIDTFDLLGWSMGGFVAQAVALRAPQSVRRLIVAASKPGPIANAPQPSAEASRVASKPVNDAEDFLYLFFPRSTQGRVAGTASLERLERWPSESPATLSPAGTGAQTEALVAWSQGRDAASERLGELTLPVLLGHGAHDLLMDPYHAYAMTKQLLHAKLVLYGDAGHAFLFQHHEDFAREVLDFLR